MSTRRRSFNHRCQRITQAERHHYEMDADQVWKLIYETNTKTFGLVTHSRYATTVQARQFCYLNELTFPPAPAAAPV